MHVWRYPSFVVLPLLWAALSWPPPCACQALTVVDSVDVLFNLIMTGVDLKTLDITRVNGTQIVERLNALAASDSGTYGMLKDAYVPQIAEQLSANLVTVNECPVGSYVDPVGGACTPCPSGYYSTKALANSFGDCVPCPAGTFSNASGASSLATCQSCPVGTFSSVAGANSSRVCGGCGANMVSNAGAQSASGCVCLPGYYMVGGGATQLGVCTQCEPGSYCSGSTKSSCPSAATSQPGSVVREDCYCVPGYYGVASAVTGCSFCDAGYYCTGQLTSDQYVKNQAVENPCPANSNSPAGATSLDQCVCTGNYRKQASSPASRTVQVSAAQCNCTNDYQCSSSSCTACRNGVPCAAGQTLTCAQGYVQHLGTSATWGVSGFPAPGTWYIAPPGAQRLYLRVYDVNTGASTNKVTVYACEAAGCPLGTNVVKLDTASNNPLNDRVLQTPAGYGAAMVVWEATQSVASSAPFKVEYASLRACGSTANVSVTLGPVYYSETQETVNPTQVDLSWPLLAWVGDTLTISTYPSQSQVPVDVLDSTWSSAMGPGVTQWQPGSPGVYYVVDLSMPSRFRQVQVLPQGLRTVTVYYSAAPGATSYTLSGDYASGAGSPDIALVRGETLVLSRLSSGNGVMLLRSYNATSGAFALLDGSDVVGQSTSSVAQPSLTWSTSGRETGVYYYASASSAGSVRVGRILLYEAPGGAQCIVCQIGEYCYNGNAVNCPPNSVSPAGSTSVSDCQCSAGFAVSTTDMGTYQNGQAVDTGGRHTCAIASDGTLWCWGANEAGQLGVGTVSDSERMPQQVPGLSDVRNVSLGDNFTCAVVGSGLMVKCWGGNYWGQLGMDAVDDYVSSPPADGWSRLGGVTVSGGVTTVNAYATKALSCGKQSCCAIVTKSSGSDSLTCWGKGDNGQLGEGEAAAKRRCIGTGTTNGLSGARSPYAATGAVSLGFGVEKAVLVTVGGEHACAAMASGAVWCWGSNANGAIGKGTGQQWYNPTAVSLGGLAKTVNCYSLVCCAVMQPSFAVKCWGKGGDGRLGTGLFDVGVTADSMGVNLQPVQLGAGLYAIDVNVGQSQTCALLSNNGVKCWGLTGTNIVGDNPPIEMSDLLPNVALVGTQVVLQMSGKGFTTCVVMSDYQVACWGDNGWGQLGAVPAAGSARNMTLVAFSPAGWTALASSGTPLTLSCSACAPNTYCVGGATPAQSCPANTMSVLQASRRDDCRCVPGTKKVGSGAGATCVTCTGPEWCINGGATSCGQNSATTADGSSSRSACACARGYFYSSVTQQCSPCGQGLYKDSVGNAGNCTRCPAGTQSTATALGNASGCGVCGPGSYSGAGAISCSPCSTGTAAPAGSSACSACGPGFYSDGTDAYCRPCAAGTYDDEPRNGQPGTCAKCVPGYYSTALNATLVSTCRKCPAGNVSDEGASSCRPCGAGEYSVEGTQGCLACPGNSTSAGGSAYGQCKCLAGFYKRLESDGVTFSCVPCGAGEYAGFDKVGACDKCPGGTASGALTATSVAVCGQCAAGRYAPVGSGACLPCAAWSFSAAGGASACANCSLGFYAAAGSTQCSACPPGRFSLSPISSSGGCQLCESGKYCAGGIEAAKPGGQQVRDCPLGTYRMDTGMYLPSQCTPCPGGSFCPSPVIIGSCPKGTSSNASSTSQLQCTCQVGYSCNYQRVVNAVVTLLMSLQDWNANSAVRTAFVNAVAQSARTTADKVVIASATASRSSMGGGARRLLSLGDAGGGAGSSGGGDGETHPAGTHPAGTHLAMEILDGHGSGLDAELDRELVKAGLGSSAGKVWIEPHFVEALPLMR